MGRIHRVPVMVAALALVSACTSGPGAPDQTAQLKELADTRAATERFMREGENSPIPPDKRNTLLPLRYFDPDLSFSTAAQLDLTEAGKRPVAEMPTSTGSMRTLRARRVPALHAQGPAVHPRRLCTGGDAAHLGAVRAVCRRNQRHGDVCRGPIPGSPTHIYRALPDRLQLRLQPVLRLQQGIRVPVPATRTG